MLRKNAEDERRREDRNVSCVLRCQKTIARMTIDRELNILVLLL